LQYLGQGACQALEDALALAENLDQTSSDLQAAFQGYERDRVKRASQCHRGARPWGAWWHTRDEITLAVRNRYFKLRTADDYSELDWLYSPIASNTFQNHKG